MAIEKACQLIPPAGCWRFRECVIGLLLRIFAAGRLDAEMREDIKPSMRSSSRTRSMFRGI